MIVTAGLASSNGEAIRKIKEGAVSLDGRKITDFQKEYTFDKPTVLKLGRRFARFIP
jgi:tyrosyl-tRNA synthetase